jgi:hypothetical protein
MCSDATADRWTFKSPEVRRGTAFVVQWSEFLAIDPEARIRFPELSEFLRSSGSGTGFTQYHEYNWGDTWNKKKRLRSRKLKLRPQGIRRADYATPFYQKKLALTSQTSGGRSVGIVRSRTQATEFVLLLEVRKGLQLSFNPLELRNT